jgi:hypothetical protein
MKTLKHPVWKKLKINKNDKISFLLNKLKENNTEVSSWAKEIIENQFFYPKEMKTNLFLVSHEDLGFENIEVPFEAKTERLRQLGFTFAPEPAIGALKLRLLYNHQPNNEFLIYFSKPVIDSADHPYFLTLMKGGISACIRDFSGIGISYIVKAQ